MFFAQDAYREACSANSCDDLLFAMYEISGSQAATHPLLHIESIVGITISFLRGCIALQVQVI